MFRKMRRAAQLLTEQESIEILKKCSSGVLAVSGDDDYPYAVPLSYVYENGRLYFHCALTGHKIDGIKRNEKASFCVVDKDEVIPEKYTTLFRSVIVFGKAKIIENKEEKIRIALMLGEKYNPGHIDDAMDEINRLFSALCIIELNIEHITGKAAKELAAIKKDLP